jgi:hypothetical protein
MSRLTRAALTLACLLHVNVATADPFVIDQQFAPSIPPGSGEFLASVQPLSLGPTYGQVFTVGISGRLAAADLLLNTGAPGRGSSDVIVTVTSTSGGFPTSTFLAQGTVSGTNIPGGLNVPFTRVDFASRPQVVAGQQLALLFSSLGPLGASPNVHGNTGDILQYPGGEAVVFAFGAWHPAIEIFHPGTTGADDFFFRTAVQPVPEPASMTLLGTALLGLAAGWRRSRSGRCRSPSAGRPDA